MLKRFGRRLYSAKYVYSIHLHCVSPWFMHEKPARIAWKRGSKKHKKGNTKPRMPVRTPGAHINNGTLEIEETFELGVTLYAESNKTKKTGPYGTKELKLVIMEVDNDGSVYSILGALTINLNEFVGLVDHKLHVPVECDSEIIEAVGQPYFDITIRSWYKQGKGGTSASSGISSTGWTVAGSDSEEDHNVLLTTGESHEDPVKLVDAVSPSPMRTSSTYTMDSVPENIDVEGNVTQEQDRVVVTDDKAEPVQQTTTSTTAAPDKIVANNTVTSDVNTQADASLKTNEAEKNNVHVNAVDQEEEVMESPPAVTANQRRSDTERYPILDPSSLMLHRRFDRLSTITSEAGDEAMALEENEDELNKFLKAEMGNAEPGLEGIPDVVISPTTDFVAPIQEEEDPQLLPPEPTTPKQIVRDVDGKQEMEQQSRLEAMPEITFPQEMIANKSDVMEPMAVPSSPLPEGQTGDESPAFIVVDNAKQTHSSKKELQEDVPNVLPAPVPATKETPQTSKTSGKVPEEVVLKDQAHDAAPQDGQEVGSKVTSKDASPSKSHPQRYSSPRRYPPSRRGFWWFLPGSNLVCCQPALPREP